uniref:Uncharacterized protein n=1 Tax=Oryza nivara TaxID=4536 RepID=A0A0E0INZ7_ORYNI
VVFGKDNGVQSSLCNRVFNPYQDVNREKSKNSPAPDQAEEFLAAFTLLSWRILDHEACSPIPRAALESRLVVDVHRSITCTL